MTDVDAGTWVIDEVDERWSGVLESITKNETHGLAPWHPLSREPRLAQLAFRSYLDSSERSTNAVAAAMQLEAMVVRRWSNQYEWEYRAQYYDTWVARQMDDARDELLRAVAFDNTKAFSKLPGLVEMCGQLVQGSLTEQVRKQEKAAKDGMPDEAVPLNQAMKLAETMRGLMEATNRFLGMRQDININIGGKVTHDGKVTVTPFDLSSFVDGLGDANLLGERRAIEATAAEEGDDG